MTPLDAFDTMLLMGLDDEAAEAKALILEQLTFDHDFSVQVFEIVIRTLGGLITAYQMDGDERFPHWQRNWPTGCSRRTNRQQECPTSESIYRLAPRSGRQTTRLRSGPKCSSSEL